MTNRCRICGEPKATQALFDSHPSDCDCVKCCAVCWREFGQHCDEPDAAALLAEIDRLRALMEEAYREGFREGMKASDGLYLASEAWAESDARAALNNNDTPQEG